MPRKPEESSPWGFKGYGLVYRGGHHDIFCNGERHFTLTGTCLGEYPLGELPEDGLDETVELRFGDCNCRAYGGVPFRGV